MSNDLFSPNEEVKSFTWETKPKRANQYSITLGLSSWSPRLLKGSHCTLGPFPNLCYCSWGVQHISADIEHWWRVGGRSDIQVCRRSHHPCFDVYCFFFFFNQLWLCCFVLGWEFVCEPFLFGLFLPWWYKQFIKIVLKEILRCVPSDVGHLLYSTCPHGAEITSISSCKLETLHVIRVFRYIISFSVFMNICAQWDLA